MADTTQRPIILAAGGTGGHFFPAEALARELLARGEAVALVTDKRGQAFGDSLPEVTVHRIRSAAPGGNLLAKMNAAWQMGLGLLGANALMRHLKPAAVVGFGGYPSVPTVYAAAQGRVPVMLHEQNAVLGRANRMLAAAARRIAVAFPEVAAVKAEHRPRLVRTGNPVRPAVAAQRDAAYAVPAPGGPVRILVMGGSQGARVFSEVIPEALGRLPADLRARIHLAQQCRPEDLEAARAAYAGMGLGGLELESFFRDVPDRLAACHLAITRAGASTIAELTCIGRPAILVPYPHAMDDHQTANARQLAAAGAAWVMAQPDFTADALAARLTELLESPDALTAAAQAAHGWGMADAARRLADAVLDMIANPNHARTKEAAE
ncbi:undecaprenyldiphospho-muramoylpentapeptide beta-N-acetylglucosaminyltransferase [Azospirillum brasilense]|uniref:UDP-N-acetylglucosamine--N-acetylmuramyl-(pentapeptide) pyrophosphoryl-undecaprenol N-acetylglucosamine transferase n=2 Tax=Azospirillum brasilense TaxID=192 RepID=A0A0P0EAX3_AZOBR|nr:MULTISPECIES: undecaprenyldiphospho-muramoylpentapeptide beta-N-acetylglucosaminyltransferase [Azospirillum]ALJ34638.1 UDP-N-acetylglucosamine--N-acetylmuramyl-(pentapeptide) pyrophosphoryl-undecaprenol N-acetylglucosamine transferase [Azospirillum brasilense]MDW7553996.1 undecaprenyldiphospho-muramoylpentapeptide beta-N-acetylglucosaminyltransferase [Azospirillum brasilense]MDW7593037.1 undecaprenyldiphospho-muramoylpentapeptide beta-N-acetylglucosaminyltransferase [Azospirillum brasilense]